MLTIWTTCMVVMVGALCASGMASGRPVQLLFSNDDSVMRERFSLYEKTFHKRYTTDMERERRYTAYCYNMKRAVELAALNPHATFGETSMSDVDVRSWPRLATPATPSVATPTTTDEPLPVEVNWATRGGVTPVLNMGQCGDGCSFSVTGTIEGTWFAATNKLVPLSAQELTSCVSDAWGGGCNGCSNSADYEYILHNKSGKIATNASFPYTSGGGNVPQCKQATEVGAVIKSWSRLPQNEGDMAAYVAHHAPINVGFDATSWTCFTGGIMTNCEAQDLSHSATLVGYNDRNASLPYWIIKNEWSTAWGNAGYMWLIKGINACLIATDATVVTVAP